MPANEPRKTKADRREAARKEAERLAAKQASTERRNRLVILVASVLVVALIGVAGFFIWKESQRTLLSEFEGARPTASTDTGGIPFGEGAVAGATVEDVPELTVYLDFMCVHCATFESVNGEDIRTLLEAGEVTLVAHPLNYLDAGDTYSSRTANAFATVASDAPEAAYDFMQALFENRPEDGVGLTDEVIAEIAVGAGVPEEVAATFASGTYLDWVAVASDQARSDGVSGTPRVYLDGSVWDEDYTTPGNLLEAVRAAA